MFLTLSALWYKWARKNHKEFTHIKDSNKFGRALMVMMVKDDLIFDKKAWTKKWLSNMHYNLKRRSINVDQANYIKRLQKMNIGKKLNEITKKSTQNTENLRKQRSIEQN